MTKPPPPKKPKNELVTEREGIRFRSFKEDMWNGVIKMDVEGAHISSSYGPEVERHWAFKKELFPDDDQIRSLGLEIGIVGSQGKNVYIVWVGKRGGIQLIIYIGGIYCKAGIVIRGRQAIRDFFFDHTSMIDVEEQRKRDMMRKLKHRSQ